jgi:hypothetical protein
VDDQDEGENYRRPSAGRELREADAGGKGPASFRFAAAAMAAGRSPAPVLMLIGHPISL